MSRVSKSRTYHEINGRRLYEKRFDEVMSFHEPGLAPARMGNYWFHIKPEGERAYGCVFYHVWVFYFGLAAVRSGRDYYHILPDGRAAYSSRYEWCGNFQDALCTVMSKERRYFHILKNGKRAYKQDYNYAGDFKEGFAVVQMDDRRFQHIDREGNHRHYSPFLGLEPFHKGLAAARDSAGWFHINLRGEPMYSRRFAFVEPYYNGRSKVIAMDGSHIVIDKSGNTVLTIHSATVE